MTAGWTALWWLACAGPTATGPADAHAGEAVYTTYCASCHQSDGSGIGPGGNRLGAPFVGPESRLTQADDRLAESIRNGRTGAIGAMPAWKGVLSDAQQRDVLAYLRAQFGSAAAPGSSP